MASENLDHITDDEVVAADTPEAVVAVKRSYTGQLLKPVLARRENKGKKGVQACWRRQS